jgi:hypothetical protein
LPRTKIEVVGNLSANNGDSLRAVAGQGIIYEPTFVDDLTAGTLVAITLAEPAMELGGIYAVYLPERNPAAKGFALSLGCSSSPPLHLGSAKTLVVGGFSVN